MGLNARDPERAERASPGRAADVAVDGLFAGVLGGLAVAVFFLLVDSLKGQPLFTPSLLGSALFLGKNVDAVQGVDIPMVFAYTGVHALLFVATGMAAAYMVAQFERNPPFGLLLLLLLICFEAGFVALTAALMPGVIGAVGAVLILVANLLAAVAMAGYLLWWSHPGAVRSLDRIWQD